jgi:biopolymer transport protein TolR
MGMSTGGNKGGLQSEINVTPLIDVLLVLLIIFLVVMPIMMKMETLQIPRNLNDTTEAPDPNATMLTVLVKPDLTLEFSDGVSETPTPVSNMVEMLKLLRPKLEQAGANGKEKVVFVDFDKAVPWVEVVNTMDTIRSLATDINKDEIKVALKIKKEDTAQSPL